MGKIRRPLLAAALLAPVIVAAANIGSTRRFYPDDPLWIAPRPLPVPKANKRDINLLYDFLSNSLATPGEKQQPAAKLIHAMDVNTLGEVPDSDWYTNRHYWHRMSIAELKRGPGDDNQPVPPFTITGAKSEGITPGFQMTDARRRKYYVKADPRSNPHLASAADVIGSKFFYALGYNTPENYIAYLTKGELKISPKAKIKPPGGHEREMTEFDLDPLLEHMPREHNGRYRVLASLDIGGQTIGPARWYGTRTNDPNDIFPHEHRRTSRGLYVVAAWLNHTDIKAGQTFDTIVDDGGVPHIKHYLVDFGSMLGSDSDDPKNVRLGHRYMIERDPAVLAKMLTAGLWVEDWERADYGNHREVGRFTAEAFHPDRWTSNYPNPAFLNRLPDDEFWSAKQVMAFTNQEIRAIVETGEYSDPAAVDYLAGTLAKRRDIIGRTYFAKVLPLDRFEVRGGELSFHNLAVDHGLWHAPRYTWEWATFDNESGQPATTIAGATGSTVPLAAQSGYVVATIRAAGRPEKSVRVYVRGSKVVGIDRTW